MVKSAIESKALLVIAALVCAVAVACGNKCEELATERAKCSQTGEGGGAAAEAEDDCSDSEDKCAGCLLDSNEDLCDPQGDLAARTACVTECEDVTP
jgi:hypothetical protein